MTAAVRLPMAWMTDESGLVRAENIPVHGFSGLRLEGIVPLSYHCQSLAYSKFEQPIHTQTRVVLPFLFLSGVVMPLLFSWDHDEGSHWPTVGREFGRDV